MAVGDKADYELNYVYNPAKASEYRSVNVVLKILNNKIRFTISSDDEIEPDDLRGIIDGLQKEIFTKIGMDIRQECSILLYIKETEFYIDFSNKEMKVYKLEYKL